MILYEVGLENHPDGSGNLNAIVNGNWNALAGWCNPAKGLTASQSTTTVTANGDVFESDDVGATIRFADGTTASITGYTSATQVTVTPSQTVSSQSFSLYRTDQSERDTMLRGLMKRPRLQSGYDGALLAMDVTGKKLVPMTTFVYDSAVPDFTFTDPVVMDDDDGAVSTEAMLTIRRNMDATTGYNWAFVVAATAQPTAASTANPCAGYFTINTTLATANIATGGGGRPGVCGVYVNPGHGNTTYTLDMLQGIFVYAAHSSGAANLAEMNGIQIYMDCAAASTVDLVRALYIPTIQRAGGADAWWAIYQTSVNDPSFLGGKVYFNSTTSLGTVKAWQANISATDTSGTVYGTYAKLTGAAASSSSAGFVGSMAHVDLTGAQTYTGASYGMLISAKHNGTATATTLMGLRVYAQKDSTGGVTNLTGIRITSGNTNATGTAANVWALFIDTIDTTGTVTTPWAIYQNGASDPSYFAGNLMLGTINRPSSLAKGMVFATGTAATGTVSAGDCALWFDGTNLRLRIGTTDYTLTKT